MRSDAPTADEAAESIVCSWCASEGSDLRTGDIKNADFQGMKLTRILLMRQPRGGLPDPEVKYDRYNPEHNDYLLAQVPIYGTGDAGRGWWKKLRLILTEAGLVENKFLKAFYHVTKDSKPQLMMTTRVDDLLWGRNRTSKRGHEKGETADSLRKRNKR